MQAEVLHMDSVFQFFSFSVFQFPELLRNISGETEKLKNWKTESIWRISAWISLENSVFQFFSFSGNIPK